MHTNKLRNTILSGSNQRGVGILQVLMAIAFMMVLVYAILTMLADSRIHQKKQTMIANVRELQIRVENLLKDPGAWRNTILDPGNAGTACLKNFSLDCAVGVNSITVLRDSSATPVVSNLPGWSSSNFTSDGFTETGSPCTTFMSTGNDACPFTYKLVWQPYCVSPCKNPGIRITGRLLFSPSSSALRTAISAGVMNNNTLLNDLTPIGIDNSTLKSVNATSLQAGQRLDSFMGKYDISIWRTATTNIQSFRLTTTSTASCSVGSMTNRPGFIEEMDPFNLVTLVGGGGFTITNAGTYECDVGANGNGVDGFQVQLIQSSGSGVTVMGAGSSYAPQGTQATAEFDSTFTITGGQTFFVRQGCASAGGGTGLGSNGPGGSAPLASVSCRLID